VGSQRQRPHSCTRPDLGVQSRSGLARGGLVKQQPESSVTAGIAGVVKDVKVSLLGNQQALFAVGKPVRTHRGLGCGAIQARERTTAATHHQYSVMPTATRLCLSRRSFSSSDNVASVSAFDPGARISQDFCAHSVWRHTSHTPQSSQQHPRHAPAFACSGPTKLTCHRSLHSGTLASPHQARRSSVPEQTWQQFERKVGNTMTVAQKLTAHPWRSNKSLPCSSSVLARGARGDVLPR